MNWSYHKGEAEAWGAGKFKRYAVKSPAGFSEAQYLEAWCNGNRMALVDTVDEGVRLCEWVERSGNA